MAEAAQPGHRGDRRLGVLQQGARGLQANPLDVATGRHAQFLEKYPGQRTRAHAGLVGEGFQGQVAGEVGGNPLQQRGQARGAVRFRGQPGAELGLAARTLEEHHQASRDAERQAAAEVGLDQRQGQVDSRRDAGRGEDVGVAVAAPRVVGVQAVALHMDAGKPLAQRRHVGPVGGRRAPVENPGGGQDQRSRTHRAEPPYARFGGFQPGEQVGVAGLRLDTEAAGHQQGVQAFRRTVAPGEVGADADARGTGHRFATLAEHLYPVERRQALALAFDVGRGEYLQRSGHVQAHHVGIDQAGNQARFGHGTTSWRWRQSGVLRAWPQCQSAHGSCHSLAGASRCADGWYRLGTPHALLSGNG